MSGIIKQIQIKGFQSWLQGLIDFKPGINVIFGVSNSGKSSIIRALRWALRNKTAGGLDKNRSWKLPKKASIFVDVAFDNDEWVSREQSPTVNQYEISTTEEPMVALRKDIPMEVQELTRISDVNFQPQKSWFLIDQSPGKVAKEFNKFINLEVLDKAITEANSRIRSSKRDYDDCAKHAAELSAYIESTETRLVHVEKDFEKVEKLNNKIITIGNTHRTVGTLIKSHDTIKHNLKHYDKLEPAIAVVKEISELDSQISKLYERVSTIGGLFDRYDNISDRLADSGSISDALESLKEISVLYTDIKLAEQKSKQVYNLVYHAQNELKPFIENADIDIKELEKRKLQIFKELGTCPYCNQTIK